MNCRIKNCQVKTETFRAKNCQVNAGNCELKAETCRIKNCHMQNKELSGKR